jgi:hypothetical protein
VPDIEQRVINAEINLASIHGKSKSWQRLMLHIKIVEKIPFAKNLSIHQIQRVLNDVYGQ